MKNMKRYFESTMLVLFSLLAFTACSEDQGTTSGGDGQPAVSIYTFKVLPPLNADNDVNVRIAANSQSTEAYLLAQKTSEKEAAGMSDAALADYVVANGTKITLEPDQHTGGKTTDYVVTGLLGVNTITVVTVNGSQKSKPVSVEFEGLIWNDVVEGVYTAHANKNPISIFTSQLGGTDVPTTLQQLETDKTQYRFKDLYGKGYHLQFFTLDLTGEDESGEYTFFRIPLQTTPLTFGDYGNVGVRDVGYWQGDDAFVTENGYESGMYADHSCFIMIQYFVSAGNVGYGYDFFTPNE